MTIHSKAYIFKKKLTKYDMVSFSFFIYTIVVYFQNCAGTCARNIYDYSP